MRSNGGEASRTICDRKSAGRYARERRNHDELLVSTSIHASRRIMVYNGTLSFQKIPSFDDVPPACSLRPSPDAKRHGCINASARCFLMRRVGNYFLFSIGVAIDLRLRAL